MMVKLIVALFLLAHGLVHALFVAPPPPATDTGPQWPFDLKHSWLLSPLGASPEILRLLGLALLAVTIAAFALAALAALGVAPASLWVPAVVAGSVASISLIGLFFQPWLVLGLAIDVVLIWAVTLAGWQPA